MRFVCFHGWKCICHQLHIAPLGHFTPAPFSCQSRYKSTCCFVFALVLLTSACRILGFSLHLLHPQFGRQHHGLARSGLWPRWSPPQPTSLFRRRIIMTPTQHLQTFGSGGSLRLLLPLPLLCWPATSWHLLQQWHTIEKTQLPMATCWL